MIVEINTEYIALDALLKWANVVASGGEAKYLITEGHVKINQQVETRRKKKIYPKDQVSIEGLDDLIEVVQVATLHP